MIVKTIKLLRWKNTKIPHPALACALCGRRIKAYAPCLSAIWLAQGGEYVQAYHSDCADIVKLCGYPLTKLDPKAATEWARDNGCWDCEKYRDCERNPFECKKALDEIRLSGIGVRHGRGQQE